MDSEQDDLQVDSEQDDAYSKQDTVKWTVSRTMRTVSRTTFRTLRTIGRTTFKQTVSSTTFK